jgi:hypothetical protein
VSVAAGCSGIERAKPGPTPGRADTSFLIDAPPIMRGTVASEAAFDGYRPVVVRGYGLVVGLNGTGSRDSPPDVRAHMLAEMARQGIGSERSGWGHLKPEALLDSLDTAVVIVEGLIPPAAVEGARFDVRVYADPRTATTSVEGGRLYTTPLFPSVAGQRLPPTGSRQPFPLAHGRGTMFINPFAEPGAMGRDTINRTSGRVLNGGVVLKDLPLKLILATPSHTRASILQGTINARFPQEPGQRSETAHGESDESLAITVPPSYRDRTEEFVDLLRHTTIRQSGVEGIAASIRRYLMANPSMAQHASWRWQALGKRVLPQIKELYDYAEELPRLAALRAGAKLDDALVVPYLIEMAESGTPGARRQAIALLEDMQLNPQIDGALRGLLNDVDTEVRLLAYEALVKRRDPYMSRHAVDDKFLLDIVESDKPMIYISQVGQPRIVLFGTNLTLEAPITVRAWSNQLMIKGDKGDEVVEVYYRPPDSQEGIVGRVEPVLEELVRFFGHQTTVEAPAPGLGLTYGQTVGALHQIWRQGYINADFKAEQDRILAAIVRQERQRTIPDRPEFSTPEEDIPDSPAAGSGGDLQGALPAPAPPLKPSGRQGATVPQ